MTPDHRCQKCGAGLESLWSLYIGTYWGARELQYYSGRPISNGKCPMSRGIFGLGSHVPRSP